MNRPPRELWRLLMDPEALRASIPGCEEIEPVGPGRYRIALRLGVGIVKGRFQGEAELKEVEEPVSYRLDVHARGRAGYLEGVTRVRLEPDADGGTLVVYESEGRTGGLLGAVTERLLQGMARSFTDEFFERLTRLG